VFGAEHFRLLLFFDSSQLKHYAKPIQISCLATIAEATLATTFVPEIKKVRSAVIKFSEMATKSEREKVEIDKVNCFN